jgi:hypothetical protein
MALRGFDAALVHIAVREHHALLAVRQRRRRRRRRALLRGGRRELRALASGCKQGKGEQGVGCELGGSI